MGSNGFPPGRAAGPDEVGFGSQRPRDPRRSRWLLIGAAAALAAAVVVAVVTAVAHGRQPARPRAPVGVSEAGHPLLGVRAGWELFGYGPNQVVRIQLARGRVTRTAVPPLNSTGPVTFLAEPGEALVRPLDGVPGYSVADGHPARLLTGALGDGGDVVPGPTGTVWVHARFDSASLLLAGLDGNKAGDSMRLPHRGSWLVTSDGQDCALVTPAGGGTTYDLRPGGVRRVPGSPAAVGPTGVLTVACHHHRCSYLVVDPWTGARRRLPGRAVTPSGPPGVIAPDGSAAAIVEYHGDRGASHLIDLASGADRRLSVALGNWAGEGTLAWSPDCRWLFVAAAGGRIAAVNPATGHAEGLGIALPFVRQVTVTNPAG